ncbi:MAG: hypothetical protein ND895_17670 [Pyrinomonadaceae bacterium]|nr:hypothetical protein [Pyrinomonadaceae bacterium]
MQRPVRTIILTVLLCATLSGCDSTSNNPPAANQNAANTTATKATPTPSNTGDLGQLLSNASLTAEERIKATDAYVADVEAKLPGLTRKEKILKPEDLKGVTESGLEKLHGYYEGQSLKRLKTYPKGGSRKTEEFYFYNGQLVFVFIEPEGEGKQGDDRGAKGDRLYFGNNGLVAWYGQDGKPKDPGGSGYKTKETKMVTEASAFRQLAK